MKRLSNLTWSELSKILIQMGYSKNFVNDKIGHVNAYGMECNLHDYFDLPYAKINKEIYPWWSLFRLEVEGNE